MEVNFGKCDYDALKKNFDRAKESENFKTFIRGLSIDDKELMKHTSKLEKSLEESNNCKTCKSLHECKNNIRGTVFTPEVKNEKLSFSYVACDYQRKYLDSEKNSCKYFEMPAALKNARMKDIHTDDAKRIELIKKLKYFYDTYNENPHQKGLYLHGSFGTGKTFLICAMLNELAKEGIEITIWYYPELLRSLKESFESDFASKIERLKKTSILFLDDIGAESVTAWSRDEILGTILQYRMDENLPTFMTSNLTIDELESHLSTTKTGVDMVKARRITERIKFLTDDINLVSKNRRNA